eukprot:c20455_g1_i1.p1 GENE.c20455_g1_i1~~c20455_g1_i1.p1  ORF type:complete len:500 (-),score=217.04 c20455_g1_i1:16-1458(-)
MVLFGNFTEEETLKTYETLNRNRIGDRLFQRMKDCTNVFDDLEIENNISPTQELAVQTEENQILKEDEDDTKSTTSSSSSSSSSSEQGPLQPPPLGSVPVIDDSNNLSDRNGFTLRPRGLRNPKNMCFKNSILQVLIACTPFSNLISSPSTAVACNNFEMPVLRQLNEFIRKFQGGSFYPSLSSKGGKGGIKQKNSESAIEAPRFPEFYNSRIGMLGNDCVEGQQQDAHEFFLFAVSSIHEELQKDPSCQIENEQIQEKKDDNDWETMGKKNKIVLQRQIEDAESHISKIFGIKLSSTVEMANKRKSVTHQPNHYSLHLDIDDISVNSVFDALKLYTSPEQLHDFVCESTKQKTKAQKYMRIESIGSILVLHLKRFTAKMTHNGYQARKVKKDIQFPDVLQIDSSHFMEFVPKQMKNAKYRLFGVVRHHGEHLGTGHYTCDARHSEFDWYRFNDHVITQINLDDALEKNAYILFYSRIAY